LRPGRGRPAAHGCGADAAACTPRLPGGGAGAPRPPATDRAERSVAGRGGILLDLHSHILPNVDDGAVSLEESLGMARFCVKDGISHVVATPHHHRYSRPLRADILRHVARL